MIIRRIYEKEPNYRKQQRPHDVFHVAVGCGYQLLLAPLTEEFEALLELADRNEEFVLAEDTLFL